MLPHVGGQKAVVTGYEAHSQDGPEGAVAVHVNDDDELAVAEFEPVTSLPPYVSGIVILSVHFSAKWKKEGSVRLVYDYGKK